MNRNKFFILFAIILFSDLIVLGMDNWEHYRFITKPAITISLLLILYVTPLNSKRLKFYLSMALVFSLAGDVLLLLTGHIQWSFIAGLLAFLLAHLMYISAFAVPRNYISGKALAAGFLLLFYAVVVFYFIKSNLGGLLPYVIVYMFVLLFMVLTCFLRSSISNKKNYYFVLTGALLFMLSDSLLALNKFHDTFPFSGFFIMLTYGLAQLLIISGAITGQNPKEELSE